MAIFSGNQPNNKPDTPTAAPSPPPTRRRTDGVPLSIVAQDMTVIGDMETEGVVKIEGKVRGSIKGASQVFVAEGARVEGDIQVREAVIGGEVHGGIHAQERVELQPTAVVHGDIATPRIAILEGGRLTGQVKMDSKATSQPTPPSAPRKSQPSSPSSTPMGALVSPQ
ncbi:MAG TPA: polymer-forming cytoskeletal protein [Gemmatimonadales bacterium]|nr:polymer-forming cytoskeletal protein [Gemmatimonadales bacterium]